MLIALHKPYGVLCQFSDRPTFSGKGFSGKGFSGKSSPEKSSPDKKRTVRQTLADYVDVKNVYPAGRLDQNSEGLLLLTDDGTLQHKISHPDSGTRKEYWVQLEKKPDQSFAKAVCAGVTLADGPAAAREARLLDSAAEQADIQKLGPHPGTLPEHRALNSSWFSLTLTSGRNRVVRRLCAALGHPVLRLVRVGIGPIELLPLAAGETRVVTWR